MKLKKVRKCTELRTFLYQKLRYMLEASSDSKSQPKGLKVEQELITIEKRKINAQEHFKTRFLCNKRVLLY